MEKKIRAKFKELNLGNPTNITFLGLEWAKGKVWVVKTLFKRYIVYEENNEVRSIKNDKQVYVYRKEGKT